MVRCLTSARFNMRADILRQGDSPPPADNPEYGEWVEEQDPLTHEITRVWKVQDIPDDPATPDIVETTLGVPCMVRGIIEGGIRVAGTTERFGELYENVDYARMWFPANLLITKRDRITNIRDRFGSVIWRDEETNPLAPGVYRATVFEVLGVTPIPDAWGRHIENVAMLQKVEIHAQ